MDFKDFGKSRVKRVSDSGSDSDGEKEKRREREREERKKKKSPIDLMMERKKEREGGMKDSGREREKKEDRKPKYYRDIKPIKILGVTTEPGDLHFYVEWDSGVIITNSIRILALSSHVQIAHSCHPNPIERNSYSSSSVRNVFYPTPFTCNKTRLECLKGHGGQQGGRHDGQHGGRHGGHGGQQGGQHG